VGRKLTLFHCFAEILIILALSLSYQTKKKEKGKKNLGISKSFFLTEMKN